MLCCSRCPVRLSSIGGPVRTFADASVIGSLITRVWRTWDHARTATLDGSARHGVIDDRPQRSIDSVLVAHRLPLADDDETDR